MKFVESTASGLLWEHLGGPLTSLSGIVSPDLVDYRLDGRLDKKQDQVPVDEVISRFN